MHIKHPDFVSSDRHRALLERFCDRLLLGIELRGTDATGFVAQTFNASTILDKKDVKASDFIKTRKRLPIGTQSVLLHTRFATKGKPEVWANNHPVFHGSVFTVHNGTIRNDNALFNKHKIERVADVDSEIIPALLNLHGFENAKDAFEELTGGFATASFDPIRNPGEVILATNGNWPLIIHENKNFLVWASTYEAIKAAWTGVLGTPPGIAKCEGFAAGDMIHIKGAEVTRLPNGFKPGAKAWTSSHQSGSESSCGKGSGYGSYGGDWWEYMDDDENEPYWDYNSRATKDDTKDRRQPDKIVLNNEARVKQLRANGQGFAIPYKDKGLPKNASFLETYGDDQWKYCVHCKETIANVQFLKGTRLWGDICVDCYAIGKEAYNEEMNLGEYLGNLDIHQDTFKQVQAFADIQTYIHNQALFRVAAATGIKRTTIDFIIHRADLSYLENDDSVTDLYADLSDRYYDATHEVWQAYVQETSSQAETTSQETLWVNCAAGTHKVGEPCDACTAVDKEVAEVTTEPPKGGLNVDKCMVCGRRSKTILGKTGAWCGKHYRTCSVDEKCKDDTVGMTLDGKRWCHKHSRGRKGFIADRDTLARKRLLERSDRVRVS